MTTYFSAKELLSPPSDRPAFSDRQAYVCAEMSRLAYFKFEGGNTLDQALSMARAVLGDDSRLAVLDEQLRLLLTESPAAAAASEDAFKAILTESGYDAIYPISVRDTQLFVCSRSVAMSDETKKTIAFVVFRGTEPKAFGDIKTDIKASLVEEIIGDEKILVHSGFLEALKDVDQEILRLLENIGADQVYVTGHSLGGALAILFTRLHMPNEDGACYTFGAPAVGGEEIQHSLKTPVYEVVNELDIVPRLLNPFVGKVLGSLFQLVRLVLRGVTGPARFLASMSWDEKLEDYFDMLTKYRHPGYISYLVGSGDAVRLRLNLGWYDKIRLWFVAGRLRLTRLKKLVSDHSITNYVDKLETHAKKRN